MRKDRMVLRVIVRDRYARIDQILEQEISANDHDVELLLRRLPFRTAIGRSLVNGGTISIERKAAHS